ncbi:ATP-binding protein [Candidatus Gottesmanbacteria bacterium]|nr:ATP-binding protein [Candidatus Gottesmanbacteria bacterium]
MDTLIEIYHRLLTEMVPSYQRKFYEDFSLDNRLMGIIGARGVGKTTFLIHYLREHYHDSSQALYLSADHLYFTDHSLLSVVDQFVKDFDGKLLCIDEIHRYKNWNQELKNIYDSYPTLSVIFSGSSSVDLIRGKYDLSRRAILKTMYGFSFREFLEIKEKTQYPVLSLDEICRSADTHAHRLAKTPKLLGLLKHYLKEGYYPTHLEMENYASYSQSLRGIVDKIIYQDVSSFYSLNTSNLDTLRKIIYFFAISEPGSVNINRLAGSLKKDYTTIAQYVQILRDTGLLRFLLQNKQGHALVRDAEKIYLDNSNLLWTMNDEVGHTPLIGLLRELFVVSAMQNAGYHVFFSRYGDIECDDRVFEIGGKSKTLSQLQGRNGYLVKDDILTGNTKTIPLYLFGFLS